MKRPLICLKLLVIVSLLPLAVAYAVPNLISYQGVLNDKDGVPLSSTVSMTFRIYDVATGGNAVWSETQNVQVSDGLFNVKLGSVQQLPSSVFMQDTLYLGIQVASDPEMTPRQQITTGAYTHKAELLSHAGIPIGTIMAWAKSLPGVPELDGVWVECNGQVLDDSESPLNGQTIPDLNGQNRFLRGAATSGGMGGEEAHLLTVAEMPSHSHGTNLKYESFALGGFKSVRQEAPYNVSTYNTGGNQPHENRPPYYNIVWIMRVK